MFNANHTAREILATIARDDVPAILTAVATARGQTIPPPRKVYEEVVTTERQGVVFPNIEIRQPEGRVTVTSTDQVATEAEVWVLASVSCGSAEELDRLASAYLTALGRAYTRGQGREPCPYEYQLTGFSTSPPFATDGAQVQTVGVSVLVSLIEEA